MNENKLTDISSEELVNNEQKDDDIEGSNEEGQISSEEQHTHHHHHSHHGHHGYHGHHGHHHRHRSSRRRSSRRNKRKGTQGASWKKVTAFFKKYRNGCIIAALICMVVALLITLAIVVDQLDDKERAFEERVDVTTSTVEIELPFFTDEVMLVERAIVDFATDEQNTSAREIMKWYGEARRFDLGSPVSFEYKIKGIPEGHAITNAVLEISEDSSFADSQVYKLDEKVGVVQVYFLKTGMQYYYRISVSLSNGSQTVSSGEFKTVRSPRILSIDGIVNVRDVGGWITTDGKTIRQGLLYRGSELDGAVEPAYCLTEKGLSDMLITLGIKTDMDLRSAETPGARDALGAGVEHIYYNAPMYLNVFEEENSETIRKIFSDLADPDKYPIYLHCTYGQDRTGSICYLLEALLGVDEKDLRKDYELTAFYNSSLAFEEFAKLTTYVQLMEGDTIQQKVEGYLLSIGVTQEEIQSIKNILLEE